MLSLSSSQSEPSALLSNARLAIATLIQRPSTITTSNAFDEFDILDHLIDVSNDVDRFEDGETRKFLNIAQIITASTCIYSRRVDALYKLINTFQSSSSQNDKSEENISDDNQQLDSTIVPKQDENQAKKPIHEKKKKPKQHNRSFICNDLSKINLNPSKTFFLNRTSLYHLNLFQQNVPTGNKQFWTNDHRPIVFDLLFDEQTMDMHETYIKQEPEQLIDVLNKLSPIKPTRTAFDDDDDDIPLPLPTFDDPETFLTNDNITEKKRLTKNRRKKTKSDIDLNIFRNGLTAEQQERFYFQKMKPISSKSKIEQTQFFVRKFNRTHFDKLMKDSPSSVISIFIYPTINIHHLTIRERYSMKIDQFCSRSSRSPPVPLSDVFDNNGFASFSPPPPTPTFVDEDIQEDGDIRLQTDMEQIIDAATSHSNEEQEHNQIFLELRSSIMSYMNEHDSVKTINIDDLVESLDDIYSLPLIFSQLLHLCAATQRYNLYSTSNDNLFIEKTN